MMGLSMEEYRIPLLILSEVTWWTPTAFLPDKLPLISCSWISWDSRRFSLWLWFLRSKNGGSGFLLSVTFWL